MSGTVSYWLEARQVSGWRIAMTDDRFNPLRVPQTSSFTLSSSIVETVERNYCHRPFCRQAPQRIGERNQAKPLDDNIK